MLKEIIESIIIAKNEIFIVYKITGRVVQYNIESIRDLIQQAKKEKITIVYC